jgi:hypothetical protein
VPVGADDAGDHVADAHGVAHLGDGRFVVAAEHLERAVAELRWLRLARDVGRRGIGLSLHVLGARRIAEGAPERHGALPRPLDPCIGVEAGCASKLARARRVWVGLCHHVFLIQ